jgi:hypothetical protein
MAKKKQATLDGLFIARFQGLTRQQITMLLTLDDIVLNDTHHFLRKSLGEIVRFFEDNGLRLTKTLALYYARWCELHFKTNAARDWLVLIGRIFRNWEPFYAYAVEKMDLGMLVDYGPDPRPDPKLVRAIATRALKGGKQDLDVACRAFDVLNDKRGLREVRRLAVRLGEPQIAEKAAEALNKPLTPSEKHRLVHCMAKREDFVAAIDFARVHRLSNVIEQLLDGYAMRANFQNFLETTRRCRRVVTDRQARIMLNRLASPCIDVRLEIMRHMAKRSATWRAELRDAYSWARGEWLRWNKPTNANRYAELTKKPLTVGELRACIDNVKDDDRYVKEVEFARKLLIERIAERVGAPTPPVAAVA